jgi:hypothetical protein
MESPTAWTVTNRLTGEVKQYRTAAAARRASDRIDNAYGAYCTSVRAVWP